MTKRKKSRSRRNRPTILTTGGKVAFIGYLRDTLIPDLREAGMKGTAKDFVTAVKFMRKLSKRAPSFVEYLEETLIPDLKKAGYVETAKDFETAADYITLTFVLKERRF